MQDRLLASVLRDSEDAIIISTLDGDIISWNRGAEIAYGYRASEALTMNLRDMIPAECQGSIRDIAERIGHGQEIEPFETKRLTRDGRLVDVWVTVTVLRDEHERVVGVARSERDVTDRIAAEAEVRRLNAELEQRIASRTKDLTSSEYRIRAILDAAVDAIITIDIGGSIETFNRAAETMFGYQADEVVGQNVAILMGSPYREQHDDYLKRFSMTGERRVIDRIREFRARRKDGTEFPIQLSVSQVDHQGLFTGIVRDITKQRELQDKIVNAATVEQRRLGQELHDTTLQELAGLGLLAENLVETLSDEPESPRLKLATKIAAVISEINRQARLLANGLLPVPVDSEGLMSALAALARKMEDEHGVACRFICPEPVRIHDDAMAMHMYRIAQEALTNAVRHSSAAEISIRLERGASTLRLEVRDNGIGLDTGRGEHDGLGLRIMEHRCGLMGGTFSAHRPQSGGTVISCELPAPGGMMA